MVVIQIIGLIASLISIGGAIWSLFNVGKIKRIKNEIFSRFKIIKYSDFNLKGKKTLTEVRRISHKKNIERGLVLEDVLSSVKDYYENLNEIRNDIYEDGFRDINSYMDKLKNKIDRISSLDRNTSSELIQEYNYVYYLIIDIENHISKQQKNILEK